MMRKIYLLILVLAPTLAIGSHGMVTIQSNHSVDVTADRLETVLKEKNI